MASQTNLSFGRVLDLQSTDGTESTTFLAAYSVTRITLQVLLLRELIRNLRHHALLNTLPQHSKDVPLLRRLTSYLRGNEI